MPKNKQLPLEPKPRVAVGGQAYQTLVGIVMHEHDEHGFHRLRLLSDDRRCGEWTAYTGVAVLPEPDEPVLYRGPIQYIGVTEYGLLGEAFGGKGEGAGVYRVERMESAK